MTTLAERLREGLTANIFLVGEAFLIVLILFGLWRGLQAARRRMPEARFRRWWSPLLLVAWGLPTSGATWLMGYSMATSLIFWGSLLTLHLWGAYTVIRTIEVILHSLKES